MQPSSTGGHPPSGSQSTAQQKLRTDAERIGSSGADRLQHEADARKGQAADQARSLSSALDNAAHEMDQDSPEWIKSAFRQGAEQVRRFADTLDGKDSRQMMQQAKDFARTSPVTFLAACTAAGFAGARLLKAGGRRTDSQTDKGRQQDGSAFGQQQQQTYGSSQRGSGIQADGAPHYASTSGEFA